MLSKKFALIAIAMSLGLFVFPQRADAVPIFARKYKTSCMTCHEMFPRLNAFGEAFRLNGFRWPTSANADEDQRKEEPTPLGADANKKDFPNSVWPLELPGGIPLSIRGLATYTQHVQPDQKRSWETEWEIQTAGTLGEGISWFGHSNLVVTTKDAQQSDHTLHAVGWLNVENLVHDRLLNLQLGVVGFEESDYYHYRNHSTFQLLPAPVRPFAGSDFVPYPTGFAKPDVFRLFRGPGAMLWGRTARSDYSLGYRIGQELEGGQGTSVGFFHWAYKFGGMDHYGRTEHPYPQGYMEKSLSVGVFGDLGLASVQPTATSPTSRDVFWRAGADFLLKWASWGLRGGSYQGQHLNPYGVLDSSSVRYANWFVQTEYRLLPWLLPEIRYEETYWGVPSALNLGQMNRARIVPSLSALYGANVRFTLWGEIYTRQRVQADGTNLDSHTVGFLVDWGV